MKESLFSFWDWLGIKYVPKTQSLSTIVQKQEPPLLPTQMLIQIVKFASAVAFSIIAIRYLAKFIDPNYEAKKDAKKLFKKLVVELGIQDRNIDLSDYELQIAIQLTTGIKEGANWEEIGGCDELIQDIKERVILPLSFNREKNSLLAPPKGVLLYGPPGCGKTLLARAVAKQAGVRFINLQVSSLMDKWYGESQKLTSAVFSLARKFQPTIIFIDEIDSFLRTRQSFDHEASALIKAQFMSLWDGFSDSDQAVIVMGATNRPRDVDKAILRRMPARFKVPMPVNHWAREKSMDMSADSIVDILRIILKNEPVCPNMDYARIAEIATGLSCSDLKEVGRLAVLTRAKNLLQGTGHFANPESRPLFESDLHSSVLKFRDISRLDMNGTETFFD